MKDAFRELLDKRFGMFIHYGVYSAYAGSRNGREILGNGEWIMFHERIPIADYEAFGRENFKPSPDFAKFIVEGAKKAGIKFLVITTKHHDGFCLFKSEASDYNAYTWLGRDLIKELADECHKEGIGLGLYYSHTLDWHEKNAAGNQFLYNNGTGKAPSNCGRRNSWDFPDDNIDYAEYFYSKCLPQVKELASNYGKVDIMWFDYPRDITKEQAFELRAAIKALQPDCQINSRIAHGAGDYISLGDNSLPVAPTGANTECLITLNNTWGFKAQDHNWKAPSQTTDILCRTLSADSTLLLNVGPKVDGSLTPETHAILEKMGEWTKLNAEAVYDGVKGNPLGTTFSWGQVAYKGNAVYLYVTDKNKKELVIPGILTKASKVSIIGGPEVEFSQTENVLTVKTKESDLLIPVYKIEFVGEPEFSNTIIQCDDITTLGVLWAKKKYEDGTVGELIYEEHPYHDLYGNRGLVLDYEVTTNFWSSKDEALVWDIHFNDPGEYDAYLVHATSGPVFVDPNAVVEDEFLMTVGDVTNKVDMKNSVAAKSENASGRTNGRISHYAGKFLISEAGEKRVVISRADDGINVPFAEVRFVKVK